MSVYVALASGWVVMAYCVGLTNQGIAILSGRIIDELKPLIAANEKLKALKVFIAHGTGDNVLPILYARMLLNI